MLNKHKILYLEHEKERDMIAKNLEKNLEVKVTLLPPKEDKFNKNNYIQQIKAALAKDNFDLVLTDAYFLAKNKKHPEHGDGTNCITEQPLACLLRFCDEIQTWERETGL